MICPDDIQDEDDFKPEVDLFWDRLGIVIFILQLCCVISGVFIVFCGTKKELRPAFVTVIWALIMTTCLFLIIEALALWYTKRV